MTAQHYLKRIREAHWTQAQIAEKTGIAQGTVSKIERGEVSAERVQASTYLALKQLHDEIYPDAANDESKARA